MGWPICGLGARNTAGERESVECIWGSVYNMSCGVFPRLYGAGGLKFHFSRPGIDGRSDAIARLLQHADLRWTKRKIRHNNYSGCYNCGAGHNSGDSCGGFISGLGDGYAGLYTARCHLYLLRHEYETVPRSFVYNTDCFLPPVGLLEKTNLHDAVNYAAVRAVLGRNSGQQRDGWDDESTVHCSLACFELAYLRDSLALHLYAAVPGWTVAQKLIILAVCKDDAG